MLMKLAPNLEVLFLSYYYVFTSKSFTDKWKQNTNNVYCWIARTVTAYVRVL